MLVLHQLILCAWAHRVGLSILHPLKYKVLGLLGFWDNELGTRRNMGAKSAKLRKRSSLARTLGGKVQGPRFGRDAAALCWEIHSLHCSTFLGLPDRILLKKLFKVCAPRVTPDILHILEASMPKP